MSRFKTILVNKSAFAANDNLAREIRKENKEKGITLVNLMASPGAGKTTLLLRTASEISPDIKVGVMEADIDYNIDAEKMDAAGIRTIQVHTGGECAVTANMVRQALDEFNTEGLDLVFLENVGNLVCPAEEDTGADLNVAILSVPEGDDKPLKYPLMFQVCHAVIINKIDTKGFFKFDEEKVVNRIHNCNPESKIFFLSGKTGEGFKEWINWIEEKIRG